jgi:hypothetical protein
MPRSKKVPQSRRFMVRQGDVIVIGLRKPLAASAQGLTPIPAEAERTILAHGEVTGHAHALPSAQATLYGMSDELRKLLGQDVLPGDRVLTVIEDTMLTHEEHDAITIPTGNYIVRRQREYSPEEIRQVAD